MENPSRFAENWMVLSKEIEALKAFRDEVTCTKGQHMSSWLEAAEDKVKEFDALHDKFRELQGGSLIVKHRLNHQILDILNSVKVLNAVGTAISDSLGTVLSDLTGEPKRFTHANLSNFTSYFSEKIGNGNVFKGKFPSGVHVAVKILLVMDDVEEIFMVEMNKMLKVFHRNLVKLYGFCFEKNMKALVFEYIPNGSLDRILYDDTHTNIKWERLYNIATETAKGLSYLHDGCADQLLHCDLKASNVLLDSYMCPKVTNFGVWKLMRRDLTIQVSGDPSYHSPEMMQSSCITHKCDVYGFGMMLFEVLGRRRIVDGGVFFPRFVWNKFDQGEVKEIIKECGITKENEEKAMILCLVAFWCIQYTPENRPSMTTVIKMLEKEIQVQKPPNPFFPSHPDSVKPFVDVVYKSPSSWSFFL